MKILIKNGTIVDPSQNIEQKMDLLIENGKIKKLGNCSDEKYDEIIDAQDKYVTPGLIDMHVHLRDPGFTEKEDLLTGAKAAAAGGFTSIVCMPNTNPIIDNANTIQYIKNKSQEAVVNIYTMGSITKGLKGEEHSDYQEMIKEGIVGITDDGMTVMNARVMYEALEKAKPFNIPVSVHCEDTDLVYDNTSNRGSVSKQLGYKGRPHASEDILVARDIVLAESLQANIHVQHTSSGQSIELIRQAKERGVNVTCEVTPHHFALTDESILQYGTNAKMSPPLRTQKDIDEIIKGIKDGTVDVIATDHAPHTKEDKAHDFIKAANGIVGLETSVGLALTILMRKHDISIKRIIELMSTKPAQILNLNKGTLEIGKDADITIIDPNKEWEVDKDLFKSKGKNTPFHGMKLIGKAEAVIVKGKYLLSE